MSSFTDVEFEPFKSSNALKRCIEVEMFSFKYVLESFEDYNGTI